MTVHDLVIIGAGPAGLAAGLKARELGLSYLILEQGEIAQTVHTYPLGMTLNSTPNEVELIPGTLVPQAEKPTREEVIAYYATVARETFPLALHTQESVSSITAGADGFSIVTPCATYRARTVLVATGAFGVPRRLNVPGETDDRVSHRYVDPGPYVGKKVLVVGGGNSAAEAALYLCRSGVEVSWSLRRERLGPSAVDPREPVGIKPWTREPLEALAAEGKIHILYASEVVEILPDAALIAVQNRPHPLTLPCDHVFALIGADPDLSLLRNAGVELAADGRPVYDTEFYETTVPGLYVAGHLTREFHMKNAVTIPPKIVAGIAHRLSTRTRV